MKNFSSSCCLCLLLNRVGPTGRQEVTFALKFVSEYCALLIVFLSALLRMVSVMTLFSYICLLMAYTYLYVSVFVIWTLVTTHSNMIVLTFHNCLWQIMMGQYGEWVHFSHFPAIAWVTNSSSKLSFSRSEVHRFHAFSKFHISCLQKVFVIYEK